MRRRSQGDAAAWGPWSALARGLLASAGAAALRRGLPVYAGLGATALLLFGGNGLQASTVVEGADGSMLARGLLWAGWLVLAGPTVAVLWRERGSFWLRSLPAPRWWHLVILLALTVAAEGPWVWLWWSGGGALRGVGALGGALMMHALVLAARGWSGAVVVALGGVGLVLAPAWGLALGTWPIGLVGFRAAWLAAPGRGGSRPRAWIGGGRVLALASALWASLGRGHAVVLLRGGLLVGLAVAAAWLAGRNNAVVDAAGLRGLAVGFFTPVAVLVGSAVAGPLLAIEGRAGWLLATVGAGGRTRLLAMVLLVAGVGAGLGVMACGVLVWVWGLGLAATASLWVVMVVSGVAVAGLAGLAARWAATQGVHGPGRLLGLLFVLGVVAVAVQVTLADLGAGVLLAVSGLTWLIGHVRIGPGPMRGGATVVLEMTGIHKRLGARKVLDGVDLRCDAGELALVLGENGAGKSTLLKIAAGVLEPERGLVRVGGAAVSGGGVAGRAALGYVPDTSDAFPELSVRELVALVVALRRAPAPDGALRERLGLTAVWHQRLRTLSFGQVKRSYLLCALVGAPPLLVLDEPSNGLDPAGVELLAVVLAERVRQGGAALVATNDAAFATRLGGVVRRLAAGRLA